MKEGWEYKKFEDALLKVKYTKKIQNSDYLPNGIVPIVSQEETFISGYWDNRDDAFKVDSPVVIFGDHSRVVKYVDFDFVLGADGVKILKPIDRLNARFFYHFLKWYDVPSLGYSRHYKLLKEIDVPIPPLSVQQHIVEQLDLLSSIIEKKKAQLNELDNIAQSIFYELSNHRNLSDEKWIDCTVGDIYKFQYGKGNKIPENKGNYPCYGSNGIVGFHTEYNSEDSPIIGHIGAYAGIVNWGKGKHFVTYNGVICKLKDATHVNPLYGYYILKAQNFLNSSRRGGAQPFVSYDMLESPQISLPSLELQNQFASKIETIEHEKELIKKSISEVEMLFNSRMDLWFNKI